MAKSYRRSPRSEPKLIYEYFCKRMKRQPGELNLKRRADFSALVGQFFIVPKRKEHWAKLIKTTMRAWHDKIEKQRKKGSSLKRKRPSPTDDLWIRLGQLYWNYAAWIILRGEYKAIAAKKTLRDYQIEKLLKERYGYLSQTTKDGWFVEVSKESPMDLAYRDTAQKFGLEGQSLRVMLSPERLAKSPPASLVLVNMMYDKTLLSRLERIPPFHRTVKTKTLIRALKA